MTCPEIALGALLAALAAVALRTPYLVARALLDRLWERVRGAARPLSICTCDNPPTIYCPPSCPRYSPKVWKEERWPIEGGWVR